MGPYVRFMLNLLPPEYLQGQILGHYVTTLYPMECLKANFICFTVTSELCSDNKAGYTANTSCGRVGRGGYTSFPTFQLVRYGRTDGRTDGQMDGRTDKASYRVACPQLKRKKGKRNKERKKERKKERERERE